MMPSAHLLDTHPRRHWLWWLPRLAFVLLVMTVGTQLWLSARADREEEQSTLISDVLWLEQNLRFNLQHNEELLGNIRPEQLKNAHHFDAYARILLANNTGLRHIAHLESGRARTPGTRPPLPAGLMPRLDDSLRLMHALHKPVYGPAFRDPGGEWLFSVLVPIQTPASQPNQPSRPAGAMLGIYSFAKILDDVVPWWLAQRNHIGFTDLSGKTLAKRSQLETQTSSISHSLAFDPPGHGLSLWAAPIRPPIPLSGKFLSATLVLLAGLLLWSLWALRRHMRQRLEAEKQLRLQQERLQTSTRLIAMGEMASSLAHELNQPLAAISSYTTGSINLIDAGKTDLAEIREVLSRVQEQSQRAGRIIRRIYEFMRRSEPKVEPCDMGLLIHEVADLVEIDAQRHRICIQRDIAPDLPVIKGDKTLLRQALFNLMRNGIDAMRGTPTQGRDCALSVSAYQDGNDAGDSSTLRIDIRDRGPGISPENTKHLFEPFFTTKPEGLGIGLNICRSVVEAHRGQLSHAPNPLGGTIFSLSLPISTPPSGKSP
jgi:signal transduction histidine kinase